MTQPYPPGLADALAFPLLEALMGRRSRRFPLGASIPDGPFAYRPDPMFQLPQGHGQVAAKHRVLRN